MINHTFLMPIAVALSVAGVAHEEKLVINSNQSDPAPKQAFVDRGLLDDVSDLWQKNNYDQVFKSTLPAMTVNGKQWGIPYAYYQWGVYYRKDLFEKYGISVPKTWEEFIAAGKK